MFSRKLLTRIGSEFFEEVNHHNLAISTPTPGPMFSECFKKNGPKHLQVLQLYRDPKAFSLKNLVYSTEEEWQSLVPPFGWFGWFGCRRCTQPWRPGLSPVNPETPWMFGWEMWYKNEARSISPTWDFTLKMYVYLLLQLNLEDWYLHVGTVCFYSNFFFFRLATKFSHRNQRARWWAASTAKATSKVNLRH